MADRPARSRRAAGRDCRPEGAPRSLRSDVVEEQPDAARGGGRERPGTDAGTAGQARPAPGGRASTRTRSATARTDTCGEIHERRADLAPDSRTGETVGIAGPGHARSATTAGCSSPTLRDWTGDLQLHARTTRHRTTWSVQPSTSATTSASPARSSPPRRRADGASCTSWQLTAQVPAPAAGQAPRPVRPGGQGPPALPRPGRQPRGARHAADAQHRRPQPAPVAARPRLSRGGDADAAADPRRRQRPAVHHPHQRLRPASCTCASRPSCISSGCASAAWRRSSSWAAPSATRASSYKHNPEFTMLEAYQAYADYDTMLDLTRELIQGAATAAYGFADRAAPGRHRSTTSPGPGRSRRSTGRSPRRSARRSTPTPTRGVAAHGSATGRASRTTPSGAAATSCWRCTSGWSRRRP